MGGVRLRSINNASNTRSNLSNYTQKVAFENEKNVGQNVCASKHKLNDVNVKYAASQCNQTQLNKISGVVSFFLEM